jgi:hypothetical protein
MLAPQAFLLGMDVGRSGFKAGMLQDGRTIGLPDPSGIIMDCDADAAVKYIQKYPEFFQAMWPYYGTNHEIKAAGGTLLKTGIAPYLNKKPEVNWSLDGPWASHIDGNQRTVAMLLNSIAKG